MCKRLIINSGIVRIYIRDDKEQYRMIEVKDWVQEDESLEGRQGY